MKYILVMRQAGDGCDYTIGCGTRVEEFEAPSRASAIVKGEMRVAESSLREQTIASAVVYMIDDSVTTRLDVATIRAKVLAMQDAEYARLHRKYGA